MSPHRLLSKQTKKEKTWPPGTGRRFPVSCRAWPEGATHRPADTHRMVTPMEARAPHWPPVRAASSGPRLKRLHTPAPPPWRTSDNPYAAQLELDRSPVLPCPGPKCRAPQRAASPSALHRCGRAFCALERFVRHANLGGTLHGWSRRRQSTPYLPVASRWDALCLDRARTLRRVPSRPQARFGR